MINVGILIFGDSTRNGAIMSEIKFLNDLCANNQDCKFYVLTVSSSGKKRIERQKGDLYKFPFEILHFDTLSTEDDYRRMNGLSCIFTYTGHSNFFGGCLNSNMIKYYRILSYASNEMKVPCFIRINDSEIKVRDYQNLAKKRLLKLDEGNESSQRFAELNKKDLHLLVDYPAINYENVFWIANGNKEIYDWVPESLIDREDVSHQMTTKEIVKRNTIYISDDMLFLVRKNFEKFKHLKVNSLLSTSNTLFYIGFFDTVNIRRVNALHKLFQTNTEKISVHIIGKGVEALKKISDYDNIHIEDKLVVGDTEEYFQLFNTHAAYIFLGKGNPINRYINKTIYDAMVGRTPTVVYRECDKNHIAFSSDEYYFSDEKELAAIMQKLTDPATRERWWKEQSEEIMSRLPLSTFKFSEYCKPAIETVELHKSQLF